MRYLAIALFVILSMPALYGQGPAPQHHGLRAYNLIRSNSVLYTDSSHLLETKTQFLHPTMAYFWNSARNITFEAELTTLDLQRTHRDITFQDSLGQYYSSNLVTTTEIAARFETILPIRKLQSERFKTGLGFAGGLAYYRTLIEPFSPIQFRNTNNTAEFQLQVVPRITYWFTQRLCLDLNIPYTFARMSYQVDRTWNPTLPPLYQKSNTFTYEGLPSGLSLRLGVGVTL